QRRSEATHAVTESSEPHHVEGQRKERRDHHRPRQHAPRAERTDDVDALEGEPGDQTEPEEESRPETQPEPAREPRTGEERDADDDGDDPAGEPDDWVGKTEDRSLL